MIDISKLKKGDILSDKQGNKYYFCGLGWVEDCQFANLIFWENGFNNGKVFSPSTISQVAFGNKKNLFDCIQSVWCEPLSFPVYKKFDLIRKFGKDVLKLSGGNILTIDDLAVVAKKTKYRQEGHFQPPEYLKYRYEDVRLDLDGDEVTTDDSPVNVFGSPKRKLIEDTHKDAWEVLGCLKTW